MARIRGYMAISLDGFIADSEGGVSWLDPFNDVDYGFDAFAAELDTVVLGRKTYEQFPDFGIGWPYTGKTAYVVSSKDGLPLLDPGVVFWRDTVDSLIETLRSKTGGDSWVVGGAQLQAAFLERGAIDVLEIFVIPILLGAGTPLFASTAGHRALHLESAKPLPKGMVHLRYRPA